MIIIERNDDQRLRLTAEPTEQQTNGWIGLNKANIKLK